MSEDAFDRADLIYAEDGEAAAAFRQRAIDNADSQHPIEILEPSSYAMSDYDRGYRDAKRHYPYVLNAALSTILTSENPITAIYQVAFALGLAGICNGKNMDAIAQRIGVTRACISKGAKAFLDSTNLPPTKGYMKSTLACLAYKDARIERVKRQRNKPEEF